MVSGAFGIPIVVICFRKVSLPIDRYRRRFVVPWINKDRVAVSRFVDEGKIRRSGQDISFSKFLGTNSLRKMIRKIFMM